MSAAAKTKGSAKKPSKGAATKQPNKQSKPKQPRSEKGVVPSSHLHVIKDFNPRARIGDITSLAANIKANDLLHDLVVRPMAGKSGHFQVVAGERRFSALKVLKRTTVPVTIRYDIDNDVDAKAVAVAENDEDGRTNLNDIELGRAIKTFTKAGWSIQTIATKTGMHSRKVRRCVDLMAAPDDVQKRVTEGKMSTRAALEYAKVSPETRAAMKGKLYDGISSAEVKRIAKATAQAAGVAPDNTKGRNRQKGLIRDAGLVSWRGARELQTAIAAACYYFLKTPKDEIETGDWYELRGSIATLLYVRGDLDSSLTPDDPDTKDGKAWFVLFNERIEAEANRFTLALEKAKEKEKKN